MSLASKLDPILEPLMAAVRRAERSLGPDDDWVEDDRRILFEAAQRHLGNVHTFVYRKGPADYVTTVKTDSDSVEEILMGPYQRNLVSARKYRETRGGNLSESVESDSESRSATETKQWACGSFVVDKLDGDGEYTEQHHVYLFESPDGETDVYAHRETSVTEGGEHLTDTNQVQGDPHILFDLFDRHGVEYYDRNV